MWRRLSITRRGVLAIALAAGLCAAAGGPAAYAARRNANPGVLPIQSKPHGASYGEWRARWWQWAFSVPAADNPLLDETGADCAAGQKGHVWFLAGVINVSGEAERTCTVPTGTALFFPIFNVQYDNALCFDPDLTHSIAELRAIAKALADNTTDLAVEVDGVALKNLRNYRAASPVFSITLPTGNVLEHLGCDDAVAGTYPNAVSDGYWIMLAPLPPGEHTIHFHARALPTDIDEDPEVDTPEFTLDITYHLTVATGKAKKKH